MNDEMIEIKKSDYEAMLKRLDWLDCLEAAGVDNWEGCEQAADIQKQSKVS